MCVYMYVYIYILISIDICICMFIYIYIYIYIYKERERERNKFKHLLLCFFRVGSLPGSLSFRDSCLGHKGALMLRVPLKGPFGLL